MGTLIYDSKLEITFDDRVLQHLQMVIVAKLRRQESFCFTWRSGPDGDERDTSVWFHDSLALAFEYDGVRQNLINRVWVESLMAAASTTSGLFLGEEPVPMDVLPDGRRATRQ